MAGLAEQKTKAYLEKVSKQNKDLNAFLHLNPHALEQAKAIDAKPKKGRLYGYVFGIKSNINVQGLVCNCASKTLGNYVSPYDASVIEKIKAEDGVILGMCNMDEFACGGSGENSAFGCAKNPQAIGRIPGGSSSGSAVAVSAGLCDVSLGSDTGGSIRNPASNCGVIGVKPSYGFVSRYGLIDLSMSLDQIGPFAKTVSDATLVLDVIRGKDARDTKTIDSKPLFLQQFSHQKIGVLHIPGVDKRIMDLVDSRIAELVKKYSWQAQEVKISHVDLAVQTYYLLVYTEFFSGTRRFDGRRYGKKIEESCGPEVLRRILGGSETTRAEFGGRYYRKALEVKEIIKDQFEEVFRQFDCVILPTVPSLPWKVGEGEKMTPEEIYAYDALTIPANLAELCAITLPAGKIEDIPVGLQIMCARGEECRMLSLAQMAEIAFN